MGNRKDHIRVRKQRQRKTKSDITPPSKRRVPRRMTSKGEGGWALWRPQGLGDRTGGRADPGTQAAMADPGTPAAMADPGTQVAMEGSPPKKFSWGSSPSQGGAQEPWKASWTGPAEGNVSWTGPAEVRVSWTGPAWAKVSWTGPAEA